MDWICKISKPSRNHLLNDHAFQKYNGGYSNYVDIENAMNIIDFWVERERAIRH